MVMLGQGVVSPVLPLLAASYGVGVAAIGAALSAFGLSRMVLNAPLGLVADRRGRRPLMVGGPLVLAIGMFGSGAAQSIMTLTLWRLVAGIGSAMYMTAAMIYITDIAAPDQRARYLGANQAALQLGVSIGPAIGGLLGDRYGLRAPFQVVGILGLAASGYALARIRETRPVHASVPRRRGSLRLVVGAPSFVAISVVAMAGFFTRGTARLTLIPLVGATDFGMSASQIGFVLSAMAVINLVLVAPGGWVADRWGRRVAILPSLVLMILALLMFSRAGNVIAFLVAAGVLAVATSVSGPAPAAFAADASPEEARGAAMGIYRTAGDVGLFIGPPILGAVTDASGFGAAFLVNALVVAFAFAVFWRWGHPQRGVSSPRARRTD
ncbi:MAG: MFS transporter [Acidimicrobiia bacterium]|nr:MFS transporter [Acidimicrobiia bacterium]MDH5294223.1 MFS transporter [Acidimicrobiia bacterium]